MTEPAPWTKIYNRVKSQIPAAPDALIRQEVSNTMLDFTQDTNLWQETVDLNIQPNVFSYPFTVTSGTPNRLMVVYKDGDPNQYWADNWISMQVPGIIVIKRGQPSAVLWHAIIAKATSTEQTTGLPPVSTGYPVIDQWIVDQWSDAIYYGTMWFLQRQPGKPFRDPNAAKENAAFYSSQKAHARSSGIRSNTYNGQNWMFPQSYATVSRKGWA